MAASAVADIQSTFGAALILFFFNCILLGMAVIQLWAYYWYFRRSDPPLLKAFITILVALNCLQAVLCLHAFYWYFILNFGNVDNLQFNMWSINIQGGIVTFVNFSVQVCYARRVYILSKKILLFVLIVGLGSIVIVTGYMYIAKEFQLKQFSRYASSLTTIATLGLIALCLTDILIATSMCWLLYRKKTGLAKTDSMLMTLISYSVSTGLLTSLISIATLISFLAAPSSLIAEAFYWMLDKCHVNALLAMLNSRHLILELKANDNTTFYIASIIDARSKGFTQSSASQSTGQPATSATGQQPVTVMKEYTTCTDDYIPKPVLDVEQ